MRQRFLVPVILAALALSACSTPPITTPTVESTVTMNQIVPGMPDTPMPVLVPPAGPFDLPALGIDVPANARSVTLSSAILHLDVRNQMKIPLSLGIFLGGDRDQVYDAANLLGEVEIAPEQTGRIDQNVKDPTLFKAEKVWVGIRFRTAGSNGKLVTVQGSDAIVIGASATVQVKLF